MATKRAVAKQSAPAKARAKPRRQPDPSASLEAGPADAPPPPKPPARRSRSKGPLLSLTPPPDYFERTKHGPVNVMFLAPWMLVYVLCWWLAGDRVETQAAAWLRNGLRLLGHRALFTVTLVTALGLCALLLLRTKEAKKDVPVFPLMLAEGALYGLLLYGAGTVLSRFLPVGQWMGLFSSADPRRTIEGLGTAVGAGIYEEIVFRGILCWAFVHVMRGVVGADRWSSGALAVLASALLFAAYHHWGPGGEPWEALRFTFRLHAGLLLGAVFLTRGLGIAAFAHGFYDALVLLA